MQNLMGLGKFIESNSPKTINRTEGLSNGKFIERKVYRTESLSNGKFIESNSPKIIHRKQLIDRRVYRTENLLTGKFIERKVCQMES